MLVGAVAVDAGAAEFWADLVAALALRQVRCDLLLFASYARLNRGLLRGDIDLAWNSPLAWLAVSNAARRAGRTTTALAMRDCDRDRRGVVVVDRTSPLEHPMELRGKRVAVGNWNHPLATLLPLLALDDHGLQVGRDFELVLADPHGDVHGDLESGERDAALALQKGHADAACLTADTLRRLTESEGHAGAQFAPLRAAPPRVIWRTVPQDACNLTAIDPVPTAARRLAAQLWMLPGPDGALLRLFAKYGFSRWLPGRVTEYGELQRAVQRFAASADSSLGLHVGTSALAAARGKDPPLAPRVPKRRR